MIDRTRATKLLVLGALVALAGCVLLDRVRSREVAFGFDHSIHVEQGLDCTDCHLGAEDEDDPGIPTLPQCMLCHEEIDAEKPDDRKVATLFDGNAFRATRRTALSAEVKFSHLTHVSSDLECATCHTGIEENKRVSDLPRVDMDACTKCHATRGEDTNDCAVCHNEISTTHAPSSHDAAWLQRHGAMFRSGATDPAARCSVCHSESTCNTCHQEVPPANHNDYWRRRGHGISARMDRATCAVCHRTDTCERCHEQDRPISHTGMFGGTKDTHCLTCHFPLSAEACITCHKDTPSHLMATPLPTSPMHSPALNCSQ